MIARRSSHRQRLQRAFFQFEVEFILHGALRTRAVACGTQKLMLYSEEDWVISTTENARTRHCGKTRAAIPTMPFIPRAGNAKHRHVIEIKYLLPANRRHHCWRQSTCRACGLPVFLIRQRDLELGNRVMVRGRHFGAEARKLHRFLIRHRLQQSGVGYLTRIAKYIRRQHRSRSHNNPRANRRPMAAE